MVVVAVGVHAAAVGVSAHMFVLAYKFPVARRESIAEVMSKASASMPIKKRKGVKRAKNRPRFQPCVPCRGAESD